MSKINIKWELVKAIRVYSGMSLIVSVIYAMRDLKNSSKS